MNRFIKYLNQHPRYSKLLHWGKLVTITGSAQIIVQAIGFVSGILVVRLLPVEEYAYYTLVITMLGAMTVLSDGGISSAVIALGGKVWKDKEKLGGILAAGWKLRRRLSVVVLIFILPVLLFMLLKQGASLPLSLIIVASLVPAFMAALSDSLLQVPLKLRQAVSVLQKNQVLVEIGRLFLTGIMVFVFPLAFIGVLASGIPRLLGNIRLKKIANVYADMDTPPEKEAEAYIKKSVSKILPERIYYCFSGQINVWLLSLFSTPASVAGLGALTRIGLLTRVFSVIFMTIGAPHFSKIADNRALLARYVFLFLTIAILLILLIIGGVWLFSEQILWLLGPEYMTLKSELVLNMLGSCLSFLQVYIYTINTSRGWIINPVLYILLSLIATFIFVFLFEISTLRGVILFNIAILVTQVVMLLSYCFYRIFKLKEQAEV